MLKLDKNKINLTEINKTINKSPDYEWLCVKDIMDREKPDELYLRRFVIFKTPWCNLYIHKFYRSDYFIPHNHPWNFLTFILKGSYIEHVWPGGIYRSNYVSYFRRRWQFIFSRAEHLHRVILKPNSELPVTICLTGPVKQKWEFKK